MQLADRIHFALLRVAIGAAIALLVGTLAIAELDTLDLEQRQYCEMVDLYRASGGELGWPDYEGSYATSCPAGGSPSGPTGPVRHRGARLP